MGFPWSWSLGRWVGDCYSAEGGQIPRFYGVAWFCPYSRRAYCLPMPLNRIIGGFRNWWLMWQRPCEDDPIAAAYAYGRSTGFEAGCQHGEERAIRMIALTRS